MQRHRRYKRKQGRDFYDARQRQLHEIVRFRAKIVENIKQTCIGFFGDLGVNVLVSKLPFGLNSTMVIDRYNTTTK